MAVSIPVSRNTIPSALQLMDPVTPTGRASAAALVAPCFLLQRIERGREFSRQEIPQVPAVAKPPLAHLAGGV